MRNTSIQDFWHTSSDLKKVVSPIECRAWLALVLLNSHWHLLTFDWIDSEIRIYDSFAKSPPNPRLIAFGTSLLGFTLESFNLGKQPWRIVFEQVCSHCCGLFILRLSYLARSLSKKWYRLWGVCFMGHILPLTLWRTSQEICN